MSYGVEIGTEILTRLSLWDRKEVSEFHSAKDGILKYRDKKGFAHSGYFYQVDKIGHSLANITTALK